MWAWLITPPPSLPWIKVGISIEAWFDYNQHMHAQMNFSMDTLLQTGKMATKNYGYGGSAGNGNGSSSSSYALKENDGKYL